MPRSGDLVQHALAAAVTIGAPPLNKGAKARSAKPFEHSDILVPHTSRRRGEAWTHNGIMIPGLPAPLRFLSATTFIGVPGVIVGDPLGPMPAGGPRNAANVQLSTAATAPGFEKTLNIAQDCTFAPDGSVWRYGDHLKIEGTYPEYGISIEAPNLSAKLSLSCTDTVTWFVVTPLYRHLSLLAEYSGTVAANGSDIHVSGLCTFEYGSAVSAYSVARRQVPDYLRLPLDFFTYQIVNLDERTQLLLTATEMRGRGLLTAAYLRTLDGESCTVDEGVRFEVLEPRSEPTITPDGTPMALPHRFRWTSPGGSDLPIDITGTVDTAFNFGLGNGYVGGYNYSGQVRGNDVSGTAGYIEYIDRRA